MMRLRRASPADLALLRRWDQQAHVRAASGGGWQWETELAVDARWREQLIAELDGRPVGFVQVLDPARDPHRYWGDAPEGLRALDVWIGEASDLGRGLGTRMMQLALARCFADPGVTAVLVDPLARNTRVFPFYERLGFRFVEQRRFGDDECRVYRLERSDVVAAGDAPSAP